MHASSSHSSANFCFRASRPMWCLLHCELRVPHPGFTPTPKLVLWFENLSPLECSSPLQIRIRCLILSLRLAITAGLHLCECGPIGSVRFSGRLVGRASFSSCRTWSRGSLSVSSGLAHARSVRRALWVIPRFSRQPRHKGYVLEFPIGTILGATAGMDAFLSAVCMVRLVRFNEVCTYSRR